MLRTLTEPALGVCSVRLPSQLEAAGRQALGRGRPRHRSSDRGGTNHGPRRGLVGVVGVSLGAMTMAMVDAALCSRSDQAPPINDRASAGPTTRS
jgi:hypothetical protein